MSKLMSVVTIGYAVLIFIGILLYITKTEQNQLLFLIFTFAPYWFLPAPLLFGYQLLRMDRPLIFTALIPFLIFLYLAIIPLIPADQPTTTAVESITLISYNLNGANQETKQIVAQSRVSNADIISFQELNPIVANALTTELISEYPYQLLQPEAGVRGLGIISKYPIATYLHSLNGPNWLGKPQTVIVDWPQQPFTLVNLHTMPPQAEFDRWNARERLIRAEALLRFAEQETRPFIAMGDFNATPNNDVYHLINTQLQDSWQAAGGGYGHTYGYSKLWLIRIDFIFTSTDWRATNAYHPAMDQFSDHRPIAVTVQMKE